MSVKEEVGHLELQSSILLPLGKEEKEERRGGEEW